MDLFRFGLLILCRPFSRGNFVCLLSTVQQFPSGDLLPVSAPQASLAHIKIFFRLNPRLEEEHWNYPCAFNSRYLKKTTLRVHDCTDKEMKKNDSVLAQSAARLIMTCRSWSLEGHECVIWMAIRCFLYQSKKLTHRKSRGAPENAYVWWWTWWLNERRYISMGDTHGVA